MNRVVISLANQRGNYLKGLDRLRSSISIFSKANFMGFTGEDEVGAPPHDVNPYAFKVYAWEWALMNGYKSALWLDSSVYAVAPIDHLFDIIERDGYLMQEAGCSVGQWCNDYTLNKTGISRSHAMSIPCYGNAGMLGLNLQDVTARSFLKQWRNLMDAGCFKGSWSDHRHDLSVGSIIAYWLNMKFQPGDQILQYAAPGTTPQNETICLMAAGM